MFAGILWSQIYSCWSGDEGEPQQCERRITPDTLVAPDFFLRKENSSFSTMKIFN